VKVVVTHFKTQVPKSLQNNIRELAAQKGNHKDAQTVRWLGHDAVEYVTHEGLVRAVFTDRALVVVTISGPWGQRAKPEEEAGFFDNFELLT
jgi:hypothetical protein